MRYKRGDELHLKVTEHGIPRSVKVQVISYNVDCDGPDAEYLVYVPAYDSLKDTWALSMGHAEWWGVHPKFIGDQVKFIAADHPISKHVPCAVGENCDRCNEFVESAERGQDARFVCRACQFNPYR